MFIYHFNRLIRNRFLWGFFAVIISIAFAGAGLRSCDSSTTAAGNYQYAGTINGKKILSRDFESCLYAIRGIGANRDSSLSTHEATRMAWEQLAAITIASENGINSSDKEIEDAIRDEQAFQGPNGFDFNRYSQVLRMQGLTPMQFEDIIARQLSIMKNAALVECATLVSPMEIEDELAARTDNFTVRYATLSNTFVNAAIELSETDYRKFYEDNKDNYALPDQVKLRYLAIPVSNYVAQVTIDEDLILDYYDRHADQYMRTTTNNISEPIPVTEVREDILAILKLDEARYCAETNVTDTLFAALTEDPPKSLEQIASADKLNIQTSPLFGLNDYLPWASDAEDLATHAFSLDSESTDYRHALVAGKDFVYIIEAQTNVTAHTPAFETVLEDVKPMALSQARNDAFQKYTDETRDKLTEALKQGKEFATAAQELALNVSTSLTYSVSNVQQQRFDHSFAIAFGAMSLKKGELSTGVPVTANNSLIIHVEDRTPGDAMTAEMMRAEVRNNLARRRYSSLFTDWLSWNLKQQEFKPSRPLVDEDEIEMLESEDHTPVER